MGSLEDFKDDKGVVLDDQAGSPGHAERALETSKTEIMNGVAPAATAQNTVAMRLFRRPVSWAEEAAASTLVAGDGWSGAR